jgi:hypothetical protein
MLPDLQPFYADRALADLDLALHGVDPWRLTTALLPAAATPIACNLYFGVWGLLMPGCLLACVFLPQLRSIRAQYLWSHLLVWPLLGNVVAGMFMSAGPVYYGFVTGDPERFDGLVRYLAHFPTLAEGTAFLWHTYVSGQVTPAGGISAFPSLHLANATLFLLLANHIGPVVRWVAMAFLAVVLFMSVHLGWHYAIDGYFSIAATLLLWWAVGRLLRAFGQHGRASAVRTVTARQGSSV